jgi:hypothetical protein
MTTNLAITANDDNCPADTPVSIIDRDTGQCVACHPTILDAERHRSLLQSDAILNADDDEDDPDDEPDDDDPGEDHPDVEDPYEHESLDHPRYHLGYD